MKNPIKIRKRECYQVSCCRKIFLTKKAAIKHIAWTLMNQKYNWDLANVIQIHGTECACNKYEGYVDSNGCPIHDRKTGYFRKLSIRLIKYIIAFRGKNKNEIYLAEYKGEIWT